MYSNVCDDGKLLYFFASQKDITKRRHAQDLEAEEFRLLREVDHRAKNALALVRGLFGLANPKMHKPMPPPSKRVLKRLPARTRCFRPLVGAVCL